MASDHAVTKKELLAELEKTRSRIAGLEAELQSSGIQGVWNKLKFIADITNDSISLIGRDHIYEAANKTYQGSLREGPRSLIGRTVEQVWGEKTFSEVIKPHLDRCFAGEASHYETWFEFHGKGRGCFEVSYYPYSNDQEETTHAVVITRDITKRKGVEEELARHREHLEQLVEEKTRGLTRALERQEKEITERKVVEEARKASEEKFSSLSKATFEAVFISDKGVCVEANEAASDMFGYSNEEFIGIFGTDVIAPEYKEMVKAHMLAGDEKPYEAVAVRKDGSKFPAEFRGKMFHYKGRLMRATSVRDLTERKRIEEELRQSQGKLMTIIEQAPVMIDSFDESGKCLLWNAECFKRLGWTKEEINAVDNPIALFYPDPADRKRARASLARADGAFREYPVRAKDGSILQQVWADFRVADGACISIGIDISERKTMEEDLRRAKTAAEDANRAKSEFLANMSHELRTPLNGIMGMLQMTESTPLTDKQREYVESALDASQSLLAVINDILDISRVEAGKLEIVEEEFHLWDILHIVNEVLRQEALRKKINLHYTLDKNVPSLVTGDSARVRQILFNLLGNAVKFTEQGEIHTRVAFEPLDGGNGTGKLLFTVSDTGIGISEEHLEHIFEPFSQVSGGHARRFQGTGLGLAIVKRLVVTLGGEVTVESREGEGTTVRFHILVQAPSPSSGGRPPEEERPPREDHPLSGLRVLLVEDNALNLKVLREFLQEQGHGAVGAASGREALAALERERFDVVLMDMQLPEMDGMEATKRIRGGRCGVNAPDIPIVAVTAYAMQGDRERFLDAGVDDYLAKPITVKELKGVLARVAGKGSTQSG